MQSRLLVSIVMYLKFVLVVLVSSLAYRGLEKLTFVVDEEGADD